MPVSLLEIALFNTFIGIENINKNTAQYANQRISNAKIDRILKLLETGENHMYIHSYIEKIDGEISKLIEREANSPTTAGERDLHYLFENRKHVIEWAKEKGSSHIPLRHDIPIETTNKSIFGG